MCGLAAVARFGTGTLEPFADEGLRRMARVVSHRGPDATEFYADDSVTMAFARLSLVDPLSGGQPLVSQDGSVVLIANGEIYNHRELLASMPDAVMRGGSDCEVLLPLYQRHGMRFLDGVRGMFSLILWDRRTGSLVLARDRFGIKPLYYHRDADRIVLASEMKALFGYPGVPARLDWAATLANPYVSLSPSIGDYHAGTWFDDIHLVPAATIERIDLRTGHTDVHRYWSLPQPSAELDADDEQVVTHYRDLLFASIADCATADTELGLFLSGGVDSAVVAAVAKDVAPELHTFTVLSASTLLNGDAAQGAEVARALGVPNHQVYFPPDRVAGVEEWARLVWLLESPMCGPEQFYKHELHRYAKRARPELRGMLLGAAADEFSGGYSVAYSGGAGWTAFEGVLREMVRAETMRLNPGHAAWHDVGGRSLLRTSGADSYPAYLRWEWAKIAQYNCWQEDRTAAGSGIEARVPFLDHRLVELVAAIPADRRAGLLWDKHIVRAAAAPVLPKSTVEREKVPFFDGRGYRHTYRAFARMLRQDGGALVERALAAPGASSVLDEGGIRSLADSLDQRPDRLRVEMLLRVVNTGLLAAMAEDTPATPRESRVILPEPPSRQDHDPAAGMSAAQLGCPPLTAQSVIGWSPNVRLLQPAGEPDSYTVAVDGQLRFVVDTDTPEWLELVRVIDGRRPVGALGLGELGSYLPLLEEALDQSLIVEINP